MVPGPSPSFYDYNNINYYLSTILVSSRDSRVSSPVLGQSYKYLVVMILHVVHF